VGVSRKTINTVENAVFVPSTTLALRLARALEVRVEDIFSLDPKE
jgi:putative transcriptional regulator